MASTIVHGPASGCKHTHTVIFLHGRDSNAEEFASEFFESEASADADTADQDEDRTIPAMSPGVRWVFPQAPMLPSKRFGTPMSQWFDMWSVENPDEQAELQRAGLHQSIATILEVIRAEETIVPRNCIFLGGISQGFSTALATMLAEGQGGFAGVVGLCSWMPLADKVEAATARFLPQDDGQRGLFTALKSLYGNEDTKQASPTAIKATPVFLAHASDDAVVPVANGKRIQQLLCDMGLAVEWHNYADGGHWVNEPQGVDDILRFMNQNGR